jgi:hypothetical protein
MLFPPSLDPCIYYGAWSGIPFCQESGDLFNPNDVIVLIQFDGTYFGTPLPNYFWYTNFPYLDTLYIADGNLTGTIPESAMYVPLYTVITDSNLGGELPYDIQNKDLYKSTYLDLSNNFFTALPLSSGELSYLQRRIIILCRQALTNFMHHIFLHVY